MGIIEQGITVDSNLVRMKEILQARRTRLTPEKIMILDEYDFLKGHIGSEALCESLSEILSGLRVDLVPYRSTIKLHAGTKNLCVHVDADFRIYELMFG